MKLHIGCGQKYLAGYKHIDVIDAEHIDFVCDARQLNMIADNSVSEIYACHILEHVKQKDLVDVLNEWHRVLNDNGVVRIAVPDFEAIANDYIVSKDLSRYQGLIYGGQTYEFNFHYVAFDFEMLKKSLENSGFGKVARYDWQDFLPAGYDDYSRAYIPHMDFEHGRLMSLNVLAYKK